MSGYSERAQSSQHREQAQGDIAGKQARASRLPSQGTHTGHAEVPTIMWEHVGSSFYQGSSLETHRAFTGGWAWRHPLPGTYHAPDAPPHIPRPPQEGKWVFVMSRVAWITGLGTLLSGKGGSSPGIHIPRPQPRAGLAGRAFSGLLCETSCTAHSLGRGVFAAKVYAALLSLDPAQLGETSPHSWCWWALWEGWSSARAPSPRSPSCQVCPAAPLGFRRRPLAEAVRAVQVSSAGREPADACGRLSWSCPLSAPPQGQGFVPSVITGSSCTRRQS